VPLILAGIVAFDVSGAGTVIKYYAEDYQQKDLSFSYSACDKTNKVYKNTITSQRWEGNSLVVTGVAFPNCSATWLFGAYERKGNALALKYLPVESSVLTACECPKEVSYQIDNLERHDYEVSISEGSAIEYKSITYTLLYGE